MKFKRAKKRTKKKTTPIMINSVIINCFDKLQFLLILKKYIFTGIFFLCFPCFPYNLKISEIFDSSSCYSLFAPDFSEILSSLERIIS